MREEGREKRGERRDEEGWRGRSIERDSSGKEKKKTKERGGGRGEEERGEIGRERRQRRVKFERERRRRERKEKKMALVSGEKKLDKVGLLEFYKQIPS